MHALPYYDWCIPYIKLCINYFPSWLYNAFKHCPKRENVVGGASRKQTPSRGFNSIPSLYCMQNGTVRLFLLYYKIYMQEVIYEQRERVFHRDIQTLENNVWKTMFSYIVFECLDIPVRHELELFIWLLKWIET
jgi:hypothetical protein